MRNPPPSTGSITRTLVGFAALSMLGSLVSCAAGRSHVKVSDGQQVTEAAEPDAGRLTESLDELLASCSVDSTKWVDGEERWRQALSESHILARTAKQRRTHVAGRLVTWDEILVPFPAGRWPDQLLVRNAQAVLAFTKYRPERLADVVFDDGLGLAGHAGFEWVRGQLQRVQLR